MKLKRSFEDSVVVHNPSRAYEGYTLFAPHYTKDVWLIDMKGRPVGHWMMPSHLGGAVRLLTNGNTLICDMPGGRIFEVTPEAEIVWEFINPIYTHHDMFGCTNAVFQAHRYGRDYPGLSGKRLDPNRFELVVHDMKGDNENE